MDSQRRGRLTAALIVAAVVVVVAVSALMYFVYQRRLSQWKAMQLELVLQEAEQEEPYLSMQ